MFGTDPDQAERQTSQWAQGFTDQVEEIQVTESSGDGAVRVTIDSSGAPIDLALTSKISGMPPSEVAAVVMDCMRRAQRRLAGQMRRATAATVGAEEPVAEHLVSGYQQPLGEGRAEPDPGIPEPGALELGESPQRPGSRYHPSPGADEEDFGDRNYPR